MAAFLLIWYTKIEQLHENFRIFKFSYLEVLRELRASLELRRAVLSLRDIVDFANTQCALLHSR